MITKIEKFYFTGSALTMFLFVLMGMIFYDVIESLSVGIGFLIPLNIYLYFKKKSK